MIYLDHAAATPVSKKALAKMLPYFSDEFFNPSSPYLPAAHLRQNYEFAKGQIAHTIGAKGNDIVITAGAKESINLAFTAAEGLSGNILILETEHPSVRATARALVENSAKGGKSPLELRDIKVDNTGLLDVDDLRQKIDENTIFNEVTNAKSKT